jgi:hypothetical protein
MNQKSKFFVVLMILLVFPVAISAHSESEDCDTSGNGCGAGTEMMRTIEDRMLGDELHEEMEGLMEKMMMGNMSETETTRITELLEEHPGAQGMMMNRLNMMNNPDVGTRNFSYGHMSSFGFFGWLFVLTTIIWLLVGLSALGWFIRKKYE